MAKFHFGCLYLIERGLVAILVDKILEEKEQHLLIKVLEIIKLLLEGEGGIEKFLTTEGIERLKGLLTHSNKTVHFPLHPHFSLFVDQGKGRCRPGQREFLRTGEAAMHPPGVHTPSLRFDDG